MKDDLTGIHYCCNCPEAKTQVYVNDYVACNHHEKWRVGLVLKADITQKDAQVKSMHATGFFINILLASKRMMLVSISASHTVTGRSYSNTADVFIVLVKMPIDDGK